MLWCIPTQTHTILHLTILDWNVAHFSSYSDPLATGFRPPSGYPFNNSSNSTQHSWISWCLMVGFRQNGALEVWAHDYDYYSLCEELLCHMLISVSDLNKTWVGLWGDVVFLWQQVETINDDYMVASGLPVRNTHHAGEITTMSLHLLSCCTNFTIPHLPSEVLQLRIGIHSGKDFYLIIILNFHV